MAERHLYCKVLYSSAVQHHRDVKSTSRIHGTYGSHGSWPGLSKRCLHVISHCIPGNAHCCPPTGSQPDVIGLVPSSSHSVSRSVGRLGSQHMFLLLLLIKAIDDAVILLFATWACHPHRVHINSPLLAKDGEPETKIPGCC
ncbi:hypothetical protein ONS96_009031 [Cadophora gregata f. sp. sojae]|nr:hypothetical protein ONS96_009031 [Cadophora gregata f. sp. sojae]